MKEIKTDTGYARAWTRLALEKKTLAEELRILLDQKKILKYLLYFMHSPPHHFTSPPLANTFTSSPLHLPPSC